MDTIDRYAHNNGYVDETITEQQAARARAARGDHPELP
jgi:hypothetical protein